MHTLEPSSLLGTMVNILREYDSPMTISEFNQELTVINSRRIDNKSKQKKDANPNKKWTHEEVQEAFSELCRRDSKLSVWIAILPSSVSGSYLILMHKPRAKF